MGILMEGPRSVFENVLRKAHNSSCLVLGAGPETNQIENIGSFVVGINISFEEMQSTKGASSNLIKADAQWLPIKESSFDILFCRSTLHHLKDVARASNEINRVTKKDSLIFFHEPGLLNFVAFICRKFFPTSIHDPSEKPFIPSVLKRFLSKEFHIKEEYYFLLFAHALPVIGKKVRFFGNVRILNAMSSLDKFLCKTPFKNLCWIFVFVINKGQDFS